MKKLLLIIEIKKKTTFIDSDILCQIEKSDKILTLTPYSSYEIDKLNKDYITFHDLITITDFKKFNIDIYNELVDKLNKYKKYYYLLRKVMQFIANEKYNDTILSYLEKMRKENYEIIYISDSINFKSFLFDKIIIENKKNYLFYKKNYLIGFKNKVIYNKNIFNKFKNKIISKKDLNYDNKYYESYFYNYRLKVKTKNNINSFVNNLENILKHFYNNEKELYSNIKEDYSKEFTNSINTNILINKPFSFISNDKIAIQTELLKSNKKHVVFFQHGSYLYSGEFTKWCEVLPATINFVCNDFTKKLFIDRGAKNIFSVGSLDFNYKININSQYKYDYLYITHCTYYLSSGLYNNNNNEYASMDGNEIYQRHKAIINLFGTKFKDKKICIKIQPGIMLGTMNYVPFLELSKNYPNVTIEFSVPIQKLINKSKYIISDYFSSEFINRELHYKRDIILFKTSPLSLPEETIDDMEKMFILVDTVDELEDKVKNIEAITKNRKRYDDIIEYYSSKKCDTKKVVTDILKKELKISARR